MYINSMKQSIYESTQKQIDTQNREFWDELCGSHMARVLGIHDHSLESLQRFDAAYFEYYPYLLNYIPLETLVGKRVLEIGLGYGSLSRKLILADTKYTGMDISWNAVRMTRTSGELLSRPVDAVQGNALQLPFADDSFDAVVSIGCLHHSGNLQQAVQEVYRILKHGGLTVVMVYNKYSFRFWRNFPLLTMKLWLSEMGLIRRARIDTRPINPLYDRNIQDEGAPETEYFSQRELRRIFQQFSRVQIEKENAEDIKIHIPAIRTSIRQREIAYNKLAHFKRNDLLATLGKRFGIDLYVSAEK